MGLDVAVGSDVAVGGTDVLVGRYVAVGVAVGGTGVLVGRGVFVGVYVGGTGSSSNSSLLLPSLVQMIMRTLSKLTPL